MGITSLLQSCPGSAVRAKGGSRRNQSFSSRISGGLCPARGVGGVLYAAISVPLLQSKLQFAGGTRPGRLKGLNLAVAPNNREICREFFPQLSKRSNSARDSQFLLRSRELAGNLWKTLQTRANIELPRQFEKVQQINRKGAGNFGRPPGRPGRPWKLQDSFVQFSLSRSDVVVFASRTVIRDLQRQGRIQSAERAVPTQ